MRRAEKSCRVDYLLCVPASTDSRTCRELEGRFAALVRDEAPGSGSLTVVPTGNVVDTILGAGQEADLLVVGLGQQGRHERTLGTVAGEVAGRAPCATLLISARD
jgi:nucleotide-binding universal stress UspA family protein